MVRTVSAIAACAALAAAAIITLPGLVNAGPPVALDKSDFVDATDCELRSWPYYARDCLRDESRNAGRAAPVRLVTTDRVHQSAGLDASAQRVAPAADAPKAETPPEAPATWMMSDAKVRLYVEAGDFIRRTVPQP